LVTEHGSSEARGVLAKRFELVAGPAISAGFVLALVGCVVVCLRASSRGLDLTDEGIYLITYRWYRYPELTFTSSSAIFGPLFELFGWSVAALRVIKLVLVLATSALLGIMSQRFLRSRLPAASWFGSTGTYLYPLMVTLGGMSIYSWLPQSPGYNDLAIFLATTSLASAFGFVDATGSKRRWWAAAMGFQGMMLLFVKWPSAFGVALVLVSFIIGVKATRQLISSLPFVFLGAIGTLVFIQLIAGKLATRVSALTSSSGTVLKGVSFKEAYINAYLSDLRSVIDNLLQLEVAVVVSCFVVAAILARRQRRLSVALLAFALAGGVGTAWRQQWFVGGAENVRRLEILFPFLLLLTTGFVVVCFLVGHQTNHRMGTAKGAGAGRELGFAIGAMLALPFGQALGTGNPPFTIAACAGAAWTAGIVAFLLVGIGRGGRDLAVPALVVVAALGLAPLNMGARGLWQNPFRVTGGMDAQTVSAPQLPALDDLKVDRETALVLTEISLILERNNLVGRPGITTFNGTGLAFALGLRHPPSGIFMEEALPDVLKVRIEEACEQGALSPATLPVVLSAGGPPTATGSALRACGIDFPNAYRAEEVTAKGTLATGAVPQDIVVWVPKSL
jgi:hypothetical protein